MDMKFRVVFLPSANQDLIEIDEYLNKFYAGTSARFFMKLDKKILLLEEQPYMGSIFIPNPKYRRIIVGDYSVFYIVEEERHLIEVFKVLHNSRDIDKRL